MAAGVTPGTLVAWPIVSGRTWLRRWMTSDDSPGTAAYRNSLGDAPMLVARSPLDIGLLPLQDSP